MNKSLILIICIFIILILVFTMFLFVSGQNESGNENSEGQCLDGDTQQCGSSNVGECSYGEQTCSNGQWGECIGAVEPSTEICDNGLDDDCDFLIDCDDDDCFGNAACEEGKEIEEEADDDGDQLENGSEEVMGEKKEKIDEEGVEEEFMNYIIEFNKAPLLENFGARTLPKRDVSGAVIQGFAVEQNVLRDYEIELKEEHSLALADIQNRLNVQEPPPILPPFILNAVNAILIMIEKVIYRMTGIFRVDETAPKDLPSIVPTEDSSEESGEEVINGEGPEEILEDRKSVV